MTLVRICPRNPFWWRRRKKIDGAPYRSKPQQFHDLFPTGSFSHFHSDRLKTHVKHGWISFVISQLYHIFENFRIPYVRYSTIFQPNANQPIRFNRNWSRIGKYYQLMTNMNVLTIIDRPANLFPFWTNPIKIDQFTDINCQFGAIEHNET